MPIASSQLRPLHGLNAAALSPSLNAAVLHANLAAVAVQPIAAQPVVAANPQLMAHGINTVLLPEPLKFRPGFRHPILTTIPFIPSFFFAKPRGELTTPVSSTEQITPDTLLESPDPADGKRWYLPRFRVAEHDVDGLRTVRVALRPAGAGWSLSVAFASEPRPGGTDPLPITLTPLLRYVKTTAAGVVTELPLTVAEESPGVWTAELALATTTERDELIHALTDTEYRCQLILRCGFQAAIPSPVQSADGVPRYTQGSRQVDVIADRDPFVFDANLHPHVLAGITDVSGKVPETNLRPIEWRGRVHHYYQDGARRYLFRYLPDAFKVTRNPEIPHTPALVVRFSTGDGSEASLRASVEYAAAPVVDADRLREAAAALAAHLPATLPAGVSGPVFEPLVVDDISRLKLLVSLPRAGTAGSARQERPGAVTSLTGGFADEIADLTLAQFQQVFDALHGGSGVLFTGEVQVGLADATFATTVPFVARLDDLYGPVFDAVETPHTDAGTVDVVVRNSIESPVVIRSIPAQLVGGGATVTARAEHLAVDGAPVALPVTLTPDQALSCRIVSAEDLTVLADDLDAVYDLDDIAVQPNATAVWDAVFDASVPALYTRTIRVVALEEWFKPTTDVGAISIVFEGGTSVILRPGTLEAEATVKMPVRDLVLREVSGGEYRYTQEIIRSSGRTRAKKSDTLDVLFPEVGP